MPYRRRYRARRRPRAYTWQNWRVSPTSSITLPNNKAYVNMISVLKPGVGDLNSITPFDAPHLLQRIRGSCYHDITGTSGTPEAYAFNMAALRIPSEFASLMEAETSQDSIVDITNNLDGDDYCLYHSSFCGDDVSDVNAHVIDSKSKRKFDVGDVLGLILNVYNHATSGTVRLDFGINFRVLWELKT